MDCAEETAELLDGVLKSRFESRVQKCFQIRSYWHGATEIHGSTLDQYIIEPLDPMEPLGPLDQLGSVDSLLPMEPLARMEPIGSLDQLGS